MQWADPGVKLASKPSSLPERSAPPSYPCYHEPIGLFAPLHRPPVPMSMSMSMSMSMYCVLWCVCVAVCQNMPSNRCMSMFVKALLCRPG